MAHTGSQSAGEAALTQVAQDYLKAMWSHEERGGGGISVNDLAARMGVVASTASENVARLASRGLVTHEPYKKVHFTPQGRALALGMVRRHRLLEAYLYERLDFTWDEVHEEAEILEHAISERLLTHIDLALGHPTRDPHGDPIPDAKGRVVARETVALAALAQGQWAQVARLWDEDPQALRDLAQLGIVLDAHLRVLGRADNPEGLLIELFNLQQVVIEDEKTRLVHVVICEEESAQCNAQGDHH